MSRIRGICVAISTVAVFASGCSGGKMPAAPIGQEVSYSGGGANMKGYLAADRSKAGKRPGVIVVHEWWGHNAFARQRAEKLAEMGYTALAVDMYGDGKQADHPKDAMAMSGAVMKDFASAQARFQAALDVLKKDPTVDPERIAAIGYCFGGGVILNMARQGVDLRGVVSFHGSLGAVKPAAKGGIKAKLLVLNGADDGFTKSSVAGFKKEMKEAGADLKFIDYPGAVHAFTNPGATELGKKFNLPLAYNAEADQKSWAEMRTFLQTVFR